MQLPQNFQLDSIKIYSQRNQFEYSQTTITVAPKVMQTLLVLARNAPETVSREQLFEDVWGNVVVSDEALSRVISDLRQSLGDSSQRPVYIETVKKVGYRLIQEPQPLVVEAKHQVTVTKGFSSKPAITRNSLNKAMIGGLWALATVLLGMLFLGLVLWGWKLLEQDSEKPQFSAGIKRQPFTSSQGIDGDPRFSKDGYSVVYKSVGRDGNTDIFLKKLGESRRTQLTKTSESEISPVFSPDDKRVAFIRSPLKQCKIMVLTLATGSEQELKPCSNGNWRSLDWSVDGTTLATDYMDTKRNRKMVELLRFPDGETIDYIEAIDPNSGTGHPRFSPDGTKLLFIEGSVVAGNESLQLLDLNSKGRKTLLQKDDLIFGFAWTKSSDAFVYITSGSANSGLWYRYLEEDDERLIHSGSIEDVDMNWRTDSIVVTEAQRNSNIWSLSIQNSLSLTNEQRRPIVNSSAKDYFPAVSLDGSKLAYVSERSGTRELWLKHLSDGSDEQLTEFSDGLVLMPRWNKQSDNLIFTYRDESGSRLYVFSLTDRQINLVKTDGDAARFGLWLEQNNQLAWSEKHGNEWVFNVGQANANYDLGAGAVTDTEANNNSNVHQLKLPKMVSNPMQILDGQIQGRDHIYYSDNQCHCVLALNTKTGEETNTGLATWNIFSDSWLITQDYYYRYDATTQWTENQLIKIDRKTGDIAHLATFKRFLAYDYPSLSWHSDSNTLYYTSVDDIQSDLWLYNINDR